MPPSEMGALNLNMLATLLSWFNVCFIEIETTNKTDLTQTYKLLYKMHVYYLLKEQKYYSDY